MTWKSLIKEEQSKSYYQNLKAIIDEKYQTTVVYPAKENIFKAFELTSYDNLKVVILGQDPYHGENQAQGLSFSTPKKIKNPPSLINIFKEIESDTGKISSHLDGDLTAWATQGVLLLNTILTVRAHQAKSHHNLGWENFSDNIIKHINENFDNIIFVLWGANAIKLSKHINTKKHHILTAPHPSPLSSYRGFFGCKHFSRVNEILRHLGKEEIIW